MEEWKREDVHATKEFILIKVEMQPIILIFLQCVLECRSSCKMK